MTITDEAVTLTPAETALMERASAQLLRVLADTFPWPPRRTGDLSERDDLKGTIAGLRASLADFNALRDGRIHPASLFFDLAAGHPDGALAEAMERVAQDIADWTGALDSLADEAEDAARRQEEGQVA